MPHATPSGPTTTETTSPTTSDAAERLAWLALALVPGIGARRMAALLSRCGSAGGVLEAPPAAFVGLPGGTREMVGAYRAAGLAPAERALAQAERLGQSILLPVDPAFPAMLRTIPDPPLILWLRGEVALLSRPAVAIVGSRDHSAYGAQVARAVAEAAARADITVVSGMARGLDAVAQVAALDAGGRSIGVLGHGADGVYPRANRALFQRMVDGGLLLTEHPPGETAHPGAFPRRNRLISGLSRAVVVVEAARGSGTLITVAMALEQGREVLAVPGPITSHTSEGTNRLIRDGATPLLEATDLLQHFGVTRPGDAPSGPVDPPPPTLSPTEARVFDALTAEPRHVDLIAHHAGLPVGEVLVTLLGLELGGLIEQTAGAQYRRRFRA